VQISERVTEADLEPFLDLPLFRLAPRKHRAGWLASGVIAGHQMMVMLYGFTCWFRTRQGKWVNLADR
jgi:hypothetical protein